MLARYRPILRIEVSIDYAIEVMADRRIVRRTGSIPYRSLEFGLTSMSSQL